MRRLNMIGLFTFALGFGCAGEPMEESVSTDAVDACAESADCLDGINIKRSLVVTDVAILDSRFSFQRVMDQIAGQSGVPQLTGRSLYAQWWDTQNTAHNAVLDAGGHCDDVTDDLRAVINGYPIDCPRQEGLLAASVPFGPDAGPDTYFPIGLFNRFDLAPADGAHCGEYRIVYGKRSPLGFFSFLDRNLIIFEAQMPNPHPAAGLEGCRPLVDEWVSLSRIANKQSRAQKLEAIYFTGVAGFPPVVHVDHFGPTTGQIRSNQFMTARQYLNGRVLLQPWQLREYKLQRSCGQDNTCSLTAVMVTDKGNPFGKLFDDTSTNPQAAAFRDHLLTQVERLAAGDLNDIGMAVPEQFNAAQSTEQGGENNYVEHFARGSGTLQSAIQTELDAIGSNLTPAHIVRRAMTTSCAGCHELNRAAPNNDLGGGLTWPSSLVFTHVSERVTVSCAGLFTGQCWQLSPALEQVFLPHRRAVLESFLNGTPRPNGLAEATRVH